MTLKDRKAFAAHSSKPGPTPWPVACGSAPAAPGSACPSQAVTQAPGPCGCRQVQHGRQHELSMVCGWFPCSIMEGHTSHCWTLSPPVVAPTSPSCWMSWSAPCCHRPHHRARLGWCRPLLWARIGTSQRPGRPERGREYVGQRSGLVVGHGLWHPQGTRRNSGA